MCNDPTTPDQQETPRQTVRPTRADILAQRAAANLLGFACALLLSGCETLVYPPSTQELIAERDRLQTEERKWRNVLYQTQVDLDYFREKSQILEREKQANEDYLMSSRGNIRSIFNKMRAVLDKTGTLYDGFIGDEVIERKNHDTRLPGHFLLVDLGNPAPCDMTLVAASLYCHSPVTVTFCTVRNAPDLKDQYEVGAVGQELAVPEPGRHDLLFTGRHALRIKKGEFVAAFFNQGAQIYFDNTGTGDTIAVTMDKPEKDSRFSRQDDQTADANDTTDFSRGRAYSFRLWGFKPEEAVTATAP